MVMSITLHPTPGGNSRHSTPAGSAWKAPPQNSNLGVATTQKGEGGIIQENDAEL